MTWALSDIGCNSSRPHAALGVEMLCIKGRPQGNDNRFTKHTFQTNRVNILDLAKHLKYLILDIFNESEASSKFW